MMMNAKQVAEDILFYRTMMVNVFIVRDGGSWFLVDAGLGGYEQSIRRAAEDFVGSDAPPAAVVLTHGHFDHVGSLAPLLERWNVPVYAHPLERPYLTGRSSYPPPDPLVGGGAMSLLSRLYPRGPIDISDRLQFLQEDGYIPFASSWRWIFTPGHSPGHVSLFRGRDRVLIAGDAVTTTRQESVIAVATQRRELHGPPAYFTQDWAAARESVGRLAALEPEVLASGHGEPMAGPDMRRDLRALAARFDDVEVPSMGRYATEPAISDERGIVRLPPDPLPKVMVGAAVAAAIAWGVARQARSSRWGHSS
jgi:glyoxylase-like metal-dependent hydrolase (beta-lactamase superfamily II)